MQKVGDVAVQFLSSASRAKQSALAGGHVLAGSQPAVARELVGILRSLLQKTAAGVKNEADQAEVGALVRACWPSYVLARAAALTVFALEKNNFSELLDEAGLARRLGSAPAGAAREFLVIELLGGGTDPVSA